MPDELKRAVTASVRRRAISEAELIRLAIANVVDVDVPQRGALFASEVLLAEDVDSHLAGFGER
ncbi:MAG: antitoxin [Pseudonocardia sp.]